MCRFPMWIHYPLPFASPGLGAGCHAGGKWGSPACCVESHLATWTPGASSTRTKTNTLLSPHQPSPEPAHVTTKFITASGLGQIWESLRLSVPLTERTAELPPFEWGHSLLKPLTLSHRALGSQRHKEGEKTCAVLEMHSSFSLSFPSSIPATLHTQLNRERGIIIFSIKWKNDV